MTLQIHPVHFQIHDEAGDFLAKVEMFDEGGSEVEIKTVVNPTTWVELSAAILAALQQMHPEQSK